VNIIGSKFENISRIGAGNGAVIEGYLNNNNGKVTVSSTSFKSCNVNTNNGLGGAIYLQIANGANGNFDLSGVSYLTNN
jgi:hypothetical protein